MKYQGKRENKYQLWHRCQATKKFKNQSSNAKLIHSTERKQSWKIPELFWFLWRSCLPVSQRIRCLNSQLPVVYLFESPVAAGLSKHAKMKKWLMNVSKSIDQWTFAKCLFVVNLSSKCIIIWKYYNIKP